MALVQIYLGGLVAGLHAGLSYTTWPLMDGKIVPGDLLLIEPVWRNFFESPKTVQFIHRIGAYTLFVVALWHVDIHAPALAGNDACAPFGCAVRADHGAGRHRHFDAA